MNNERVPDSGAAGGAEVDDFGARPEFEADATFKVVPVIEEQIDVRKQVVDQGGYRLSKKVSIRHETVDEPLISRSVQIERRVVGRLLPSMESPPARHEGDTLIISVVEEVLVTEKRLMLKEEIHVTQTQATIHRPVNVALRSEEILIEPLDPREPPERKDF
jgi:uncharacterized protein (TIGR02271 family)